jgi:hypothetical protein
MKIAITGHTRGIGAAIASRFDDVVGFSKTTGYDLSDHKVIKQVVEEAQDCDIFVNNAYYGDAQAKLLYKMYEKWQHTPKLIINIGAVSSDTHTNFTRVGYVKFWTDYTSYKKQLDFASLQLSDMRKNNDMCKVTMLKGGFVKTDTTAPFLAFMPDMANVWMEPSRFADMAEWVVNAPEGVQIRTLSFDEGNFTA